MELYSIIFFFFFFCSVLRPFQDFFSSYETGQSVGGAKTGEPREKPPGTPASRTWGQRGARTHTGHSGEMIEWLSAVNHLATGAASINLTALNLVLTITYTHRPPLMLCYGMIVGAQKL